MLRMLNLKPKLPWYCFGDFNELLGVQDKRGGVPRVFGMYWINMVLLI